MSLEKPDTSSEPLDCINTDIEEDQILELISKRRLEIYQIETTTGPSRRTSCIRNEIKRLQSQLAYCKDQAEDRTEPVFQDSP